MPGENRNIYKNARRDAGLTQERAAERLGISVESIRAYETDQRIPPDHVVSEMVTCYNAQYLAVQHLSQNNELVRRIVPVIEERSLMEATVRLANRMRKFFQQHRAEDLLEICEDNEVTDAEEELMLEIMEELNEINQGLFELRASWQKEGQSHDV